MTELICHVCSANELDCIEEFYALSRVTSDVKPWPAGGSLAVCKRCGCVQKIIDDHWRSEITSIYSEYDIYYQSAGKEQKIFCPESNLSLPRSSWLVTKLNEQLDLPSSGTLLDVGYGNGAFLRAFSEHKSPWELFGVELDDKNTEFVSSIPGVKKLYSGEVASVPGVFDFVSLIHVLEHIPDPRQLLRDVREKMSDDGAVLIQVPNYLENPFDLLVADHSSHFSPNTLAQVLFEADLEVTLLSSDVVPKELTALAKKRDRNSERAVTEVDSPLIVSEVCSFVHWLQSVAAEGRRLAQDDDLGVFGTAIAATWLYGELDGSVRFFVDEDPNRFGKNFLGRPVYSPEDIPEGSRVFIPMPLNIARQIENKLQKKGNSLRVALPPEMGSPTHSSN